MYIHLVGRRVQVINQHACIIRTCKQHRQYSITCYTLRLSVEAEGIGEHLMAHTYVCIR